MEDQFYRFWWLLFPLGWFVAAGFSSLLNYRRQRDMLDLLRRYADKGQEPPAELLRAINRHEDTEAAIWGTDTESRRAERQNNWPWPANVVLFTVLAAGFYYASWQDFYGAGEAFTLVAIVMGGMALAFLVAGLFSRRPGA